MKHLLIIALLALPLLTVTACGESHHHTHVSFGGNHYKPGDGSINLEKNEVLIRAGGTKADARVGIDGTLTIKDATVETSAEGRAALKQYNADAVAIEQHGIALGVAGAKFGWKTAKEVMHGLFNGTADEAGKRADEGAKALETAARELCTRLDSMYQSQESAADKVPEFKPYAVIAEHQVRDCFDDENKGNRSRDDADEDASDRDHDEADKDEDESREKSQEKPQPKSRGKHVSHQV